MIREFLHSEVITESFRADRLVIGSGAELTAPEGKALTLVVNGTGRPIVPGAYTGEITVSVTDLHVIPTHGLFTMMGKHDEPVRAALVVRDNQITENESVTALIQGGRFSGEELRGAYIGTSEPSFNGIIVSGSGNYAVRDCHIDLEGMGRNDFMGVGAGISAMDNVRLTIDNCTITTCDGLTRCGIHVAGDSIVTVNDSRIIDLCHYDDDYLGAFAWSAGFLGGNRLVQLCDNGTAVYNNCDLIGNGWGGLSIDGCDDCARYYLKDCRVSVTGPLSQSYGIFCIGDRNIVSLDHCRFNVNGYPLIIMGSHVARSFTEVKNGTEFTGTGYGVFYLLDRHTETRISDSSIITGKSSFLIKGSPVNVYVERSVLKPANGVICQLMANDNVPQMMVQNYPIRGEDIPDVYIEGRDLTAIDPETDCILTFSDMDMKGDLFNSTHNKHMEKDSRLGPEGRDAFGGTLFGGGPPEPAPGMDNPFAGPPSIEKIFGQDDLDNRNPKNLEIDLKKTRLEGVISSAVEKHRDDLEEITELTRFEMDEVKQTAAPTVNNGVVVHLDKDATWIVTGTSYITKLVMDPGAILKTVHGKKLVITVDGQEKENTIDGCEYSGRIVLDVLG